MWDKWPAAARTACAGGMITESMESPLNGVFPEACVAVQSSYDYVERPVLGSGTGTVVYRSGCPGEEEAVLTCPRNLPRRRPG